MIISTITITLFAAVVWEESLIGSSEGLFFLSVCDFYFEYVRPLGDWFLPLIFLKLGVSSTRLSIEPVFFISSIFSGG